jgi:hypothetical protein
LEHCRHEETQQVAALAHDLVDLGLESCSHGLAGEVGTAVAFLGFELCEAPDRACHDSRVSHG